MLPNLCPISKIPCDHGSLLNQSDWKTEEPPPPCLVHCLVAEVLWFHPLFISRTHSSFSASGNSGKKVIELTPSGTKTNPSPMMRHQLFPTFTGSQTPGNLLFLTLTFVGGRMRARTDSSWLYMYSPAPEILLSCSAVWETSSWYSSCVRVLGYCCTAF